MPGSDQHSQVMSDAIFARLLELRTVVLGSQVDDAISSRVISQLLLLASVNPKADIKLYIDSPGGSLSSALAIHDAINFVSCDVSTWAVGRAGSASSLILSSGSRGKRYASSTSLISLNCSSDLRRNADAAKHERWLAQVVGLAARLSGQPTEQVALDLRAGPTLTAQEARNYGLIDAVVDGVPGGPEGN